MQVSSTTEVTPLMLGRSCNSKLTIFCVLYHVIDASETAGEVLKEHLLSVRQVHNGAKDSQSLIVALWQLLRAHPDPLTRTHIILAVRHLVPLATEAPDYEYVNELVQVLGQGLNGLSEVMARSVTADR